MDSKLKFFSIVAASIGGVCLISNIFNHATESDMSSNRLPLSIEKKSNDENVEKFIVKSTHKADLDLEPSRVTTVKDYKGRLDSSRQLELPDSASNVNAGISDNNYLDEALASHKSQEYDYEWAAKNEAELYNKLNPLQNLNTIEVSALECKSSSCKIYGNSYVEKMEDVSSLTTTLNKILISNEFSQLSMKVDMSSLGRLDLEMILTK